MIMIEIIIVSIVIYFAYKYATKPRKQGGATTPTETMAEVNALLEEAKELTRDRQANRPYITLGELDIYVNKDESGKPDMTKPIRVILQRQGRHAYIHDHYLIGELNWVLVEIEAFIGKIEQNRHVKWEKYQKIKY